MRTRNFSAQPSFEGDDPVFTLRLDTASPVPVIVSNRVLTGGMLGHLSDDELATAFDDGEVGSDVMGWTAPAPR